MSQENEPMCCTVRMIAALTLVMASIAATLHFTGDLMQSGIVGVVALIYAISFLLGACAHLYQKRVDRQHALEQGNSVEIVLGQGR